MRHRALRTTSVTRASGKDQRYRERLDADVEIELALLQQQAEDSGRLCCVGAVIFDDLHRVFLPRRRIDAERLPGIWDLVGGHLEPGETLLEALRREIREETGWSAVGRPRLVFVCDWHLPGLSQLPRREFDFVVEVDRLSEPRLDPEEHDGYHWLARDELTLLESNRLVDGGLVRRIIEAAQDALPTTAPERPQVMVLFGAQLAAVERIRHQWDPVMAARIPAHLTVVYPEDNQDADALARRTQEALASVGELAISFGGVMNDGEPDKGIFLAVEGTSGAWRDLRRAILGHEGAASSPHVTLIDPRTSGLGRTAWNDLRAINATGTVHASEIVLSAVTKDGFTMLRRWALP